MKRFAKFAALLSLLSGIAIAQESVDLGEVIPPQGTMLAELERQIAAPPPDGGDKLALCVFYHRRGMAYSRLGRSTDAIADLRRALEMNLPNRLAPGSWCERWRIQLDLSIVYKLVGDPRARIEFVKQIGEAVVQVRTPGGLGSGFFINPDGYLITNFHVIEGETEISVEVYHQKDGQLDRETYRQVKIIAINKFHDLALLHIEDKNAPKFKAITLGTSDALNVGDGVFAIGSPLGLERTVTQGILSTKTRELEGELYLQTSTQINPGNSGGPLFNLAGEVVGVTNMKITFGEGLGFAIPVELVKSFLDHRDAFAYSTDNPNNPFRYLNPPTHTLQTNSLAK